MDVPDGEIPGYPDEVRKRSLTERESAEVGLAMAVADSFESVGDVIETELVGLGDLRYLAWR